MHTTTKTIARTLAIATLAAASLAAHAGKPANPGSKGNGGNNGGGNPSTLPIQAASSCSASMGMVFSGAGVSVLDCSGFYAGNLNSGADFPGVQTLLQGADGAGPLGDFPGIAITGRNQIEFQNSVGVHGFKTASFQDGTQAITLGGKTVIGIHWGGNDTAFYLLNLSTPLTSLGLKATNPLNDQTGISNAALYYTQGQAGITTAVPEPQTYAMLLAGLAALGFVARRRSA